MLARPEQLLLELAELRQTRLECRIRLFSGQSSVGLGVQLSETNAHTSPHFECIVTRHARLS
jgi:hypothetical protein